jgi:predicted deacylase
MQRLEVPIARLPTGVFLSLPVSVLHGRRPGPTLWLSAALHGDEINGVAIMHEALDGIDPTNLRGTILAVPVVNVFGFVAESRYLPDRRDLNRSFPGSANGSLAARLAYLFMTEIVARSTYGIDLHTGSDHRTNHPHVRADLGNRDTRRLATAFGTSFVVHGRGPEGSLRAAAAAEKVPCIVYEAGEANRFNRQAVGVGVIGIRRVLTMLEMMRDLEAPARKRPVRIEKTKWIRARQGGIVRLQVELGAEVRRNQVLGEITDTFGDVQASVRAPAAGVIFGLTRHPLVHRGDAVAHLAVVPASSTRKTTRAKRR